MDIRKIALYLSGKISPDYKKYNRLEFYEHLEEIYGFGFDKLEFYWKQAKEYEEELYFLVLDFLYSKSLKDGIEKEKYNKLIMKISIPNSILGAISMDFDGLKVNWEILKIEKNAQKKGELLETFLETLFNSIQGITVNSKNLNNDDEEIDLVLKNNIESPFFQSLNSPVILVEAKNWKGKTPTKETRNFSMKCDDHKNLTRVGIFISVNGFTAVHDDLLKRAGAKEYVPVLISGSDIEILIQNHLDPINWLENLIIQSLR